MADNLEIELTPKISASSLASMSDSIKSALGGAIGAAFSEHKLGKLVGGALGGTFGEAIGKGGGGGGAAGAISGAVTGSEIAPGIGTAIGAITGLLEDALKPAMDTIMELVEAPFKTLTAVLDVLLTPVKVITELILQIAKPFEIMSKAVGAFTNTIGKIGTAIFTPLEVAMNTLLLPIKAVGQIMDIVAKAGKMASEALDVLLLPIKAISSALDLVAAPLAVFGGGISSWVEAANPVVMELFNDRVKDIAGVLGQTFIPVVELASEWVQLIGDFIASIVPDANMMRVAMEPLRRLLNELRPVLAQLAPVLAELIGRGLKLFTSALSLGVTLMVPMFKLLQGTAAALDIVLSAALPVFDALAEGLGLVWRAFQTALQPLTAGFGFLANIIKSHLIAGLVTLASTVHWLGQVIRKGAHVMGQLFEKMSHPFDLAKSLARGEGLGIDFSMPKYRQLTIDQISKGGGPLGKIMDLLTGKGPPRMRSALGAGYKGPAEWIAPGEVMKPLISAAMGMYGAGKSPQDRSAEAAEQAVKLLEQIQTALENKEPVRPAFGA